MQSNIISNNLRFKIKKERLKRIYLKELWETSTKKNVIEAAEEAEKRRDALEDSGGKKMNVGEARNADEKPRGYAEQ